MLEFVKLHIPEQGTAVLAGNSVHVDRSFLVKGPILYRQPKPGSENEAHPSMMHTCREFTFPPDNLLSGGLRPT